MIKFSVFAFLFVAFSTKSNILLTVDSPNSFSTLISSTPFKLMHPLNMLSFTFTSLGTDSPVNADVSNIEVPSMTIPSSGTFSPGFTTMTSPIFTSSGDFFSIFPFTFKFA